MQDSSNTFEHSNFEETSSKCIILVSGGFLRKSVLVRYTPRQSLAWCLAYPRTADDSCIISNATVQENVWPFFQAESSRISQACDVMSCFINFNIEERKSEFLWLHKQGKTYRIFILNLGFEKKKKKEIEKLHWSCNCIEAVIAIEYHWLYYHGLYSNVDKYQTKLCNMVKMVENIFSVMFSNAKNAISIPYCPLVRNICHRFVELWTKG